MADAREAPHFPDRIGRFELLFTIGTGGMGSVYLGRVEIAPGTCRDVAIKLMHPQLRADPGVAQELLREAKLCAGIVHPNVVRVHEAGDSAHGVYMAMDYVEGATLSGLLRAVLARDELVPLPIAGRILCDALTGLHAAHELRDDTGSPLRIIHRDFSPQNILIGVDGISRLADFGIAKVMGDAGATVTGVIKGKIGYMSPEQARGEPIDRRCDIWAAGVVAWETLAGQRLFRAANDAATLLLVVSGQPPPAIRQRRPDVPGEIDAVVQSALLSRVEQRVSTASTFRARLEDAFQVAGGLADPEDVGRFVRELVGADLAQRRSRAASVLDLRRQIATVSASAERRARLESSTSLDPIPVSGESGPRADSREAGSLESVARRPSRRWLYPLAIAAITGVVAAIAVASGSPRQGAASESAAAYAAASPAAAPASDDRLFISSTHPIAQLRIGDRNIAFPDPVSRVEVPLTSREKETELILLATSEDGLRARVVLGPGQHQARLEFSAPSPEAAPARRPASAPAAPKVAPPPPKAAPSPPKGAPAQGSPLEKGPGLAESPYSKPE